MRSALSSRLIGALALAGILCSWQPAVAQDGGITAREVLGRETLKAFVQSAKAHVESITASSQVDDFLQDRWKFESVYIFIMNGEGVIRWHGANPSLVGQDLSELPDPITGALFVQELIDVATAGGGVCRVSLR